MIEPSVARTARQEFAADWPLVLTAMLGVGLTAILAYTTGVFLAPIQREFGWGPELVLSGISLAGLIFAFGSSFSGPLMKHFGARRLVLAGMVLLAGATAALGLIPNSFRLYIGCYFAVGVAHTLLSPLVWQKLVVDRFVSARGFAISIALCGANLSGAITPLLASYVIAQFDWRIAYFSLAAFMLASAFPLTWLFFREGPRAKSGVDPLRAAMVEAFSGRSFAQARATREFWLMAVSFALAGIGLTAYTIYQAPLLMNRGMTMMRAASIVSVMSVSAIIGRLIAGYMMDHIFAPRVAALALALPVIGSALLLAAHSNYWLALLAAVLKGVAAGAEYNMITYLTTRYFGLAHFGTIGGIFFSIFALGALAGQQVPAWILGWAGYDEVIVFLGACFGLSAIMIMFCRAYPDPVLHGPAAGDGS